MNRTIATEEITPSMIAAAVKVFAAMSTPNVDALNGMRLTEALRCVSVFENGEEPHTSMMSGTLPDHVALYFAYMHRGIADTRNHGESALVIMEAALYCSRQGREKTAAFPQVIPTAELVRIGDADVASFREKVTQALMFV